MARVLGRADRSRGSFGRDSWVPSLVLSTTRTLPFSGEAILTLWLCESFLFLEATKADIMLAWMEMQNAADNDTGGR
jgi:hypothetical protein